MLSSSISSSRLSPRHCWGAIRKNLSRFLFVPVVCFSVLISSMVFPASATSYKYYSYRDYISSTSVAGTDFEYSFDVSQLPYTLAVYTSGNIVGSNATGYTSVTLSAGVSYNIFLNIFLYDALNSSSVFLLDVSSISGAVADFSTSMFNYLISDFVSGTAVSYFRGVFPSRVNVSGEDVSFVAGDQSFTVIVPSGYTAGSFCLQFTVKPSVKMAINVSSISGSFTLVVPQSLVDAENSDILINGSSSQQSGMDGSVSGAQDQQNSLDQSSDELEELLPDLDVTQPSVDVDSLLPGFILQGSAFIAISECLQELYNNQVIIQICTIAAGVWVVSLILFGKK